MGVAVRRASGLTEGDRLLTATNDKPPGLAILHTLREFGIPVLAKRLPATVSALTVAGASSSAVI